MVPLFFIITNFLLFLTVPSKDNIDCPSIYFECANSKCIDGIYTCDGNNDCGDNSDEGDICQNCSDDAFKCLDGLYPYCIHTWDVCSGQDTCLDGSDEGDICANTTCPSYLFQCTNGKCISQIQVCNGEDNCGDYSDEALCTNFQCSNISYLFQCSNGQCIHEYYSCDGDNDCGDYSDEGDICVNCTDNQFKCVDASYPYCISKNNVCDSFDTCNDGSDEASCTLYICQLNVNSINVTDILINNPNIKPQEIRDIATASTTFKISGIDAQDNLLLIALLIMNIITAIFIIFGLHTYDQKIGFKNIHIKYLSFIIIVTQHLLIPSINFFYQPPITCQLSNDGENGKDVTSWLDVMEYLMSTILWCIWITFVYHDACNKMCYYSIVLLLAFILPVMLTVANGIWFSRMNGGYVVFVTAQSILPTIWIILVIQFAEEMKWKCKKSLCYLWECCQKESVCILNGIISSICALIIGYKFLDNNVLCGSFYMIQWMNPIYLIMNIVLLFSSARYVVIVYNFMLIPIVVFGVFSPYSCTYIVNITFLSHALFIPVYIIVTFFCFSETKQFATSLIKLYLVSFDVVTDVMVIWYFFQSGEYIFFSLSIIFIVFGQILGSVSDIIQKNAAETLTATDKLLCLFGFGGALFTAKSWSEPKYLLLKTKHQIWEIMFENMAGVALQIYAALSSDDKQNNITLIISISVSIVTMTYSTWMYLVNLENIKRKTNKLESGVTSTNNADNNINEIELEEQQTLNDEDDTKETKINSTKKNENDYEQKLEKLKNSKFIPKIVREKFGNVLISKGLYLNLYAFMITDFYFRSIPLLIFISLLPCNDVNEFCYLRTAIGTMLFVLLLIFEFIMNKRMRIIEYQSHIFILSIFSISVLSSFFNILSSMDLLKTDKLFGKNVDFRNLLFEHKVRIYLSIVINGINIGLSVAYLQEQSVSIFILSAIAFIAVGINYFVLKKVQKYDLV